MCHKRNAESRSKSCFLKCYCCHGSRHHAESSKGGWSIGILKEHLAMIQDRKTFPEELLYPIVIPVIEYPLNEAGSFSGICERDIASAYIRPSALKPERNLPLLGW